MAGKHIKRRRFRRSIAVTIGSLLAAVGLLTASVVDSHHPPPHTLPPATGVP